MKKYIAEATGTFGLVFCGTGAIVTNEAFPGTVTHVGIAITFGLVVMAMIYAFGEQSGAHLNPAVTIAFALNRNFPVREIPRYLLSQFIGAVFASLLLRMMFPNAVLLGATLPSGGVWQSFVMEAVLSFLLMMVILQVANGSKEQGLFAGIAIGSVVLLEAMFAGPVSGASMNPVRSLAPALVSGHLQHLWIYLTAPFFGMAIASYLHKAIKQ